MLISVGGNVNIFLSLAHARHFQCVLCTYAVQKVFAVHGFRYLLSRLLPDPSDFVERRRSSEFSLYTEENT